MTDSPVDDEGLAIDASFNRIFSQLALRGELTGESTDALEDAVASALRHDVKLVRIDLAGVTFIDSSGLTQLLLTQQRLAGRGTGVQLANVPPRIARVMQVTQTEAMFDIVD